MRVLYCDVMLGGELHMQLADKIVTVPELAILRHLHGNESVYNIRPMPKDWEPANTKEKMLVKNSQQEERERLRIEYGVNRRTGLLRADEVFPGAIVALPNSLKDIGLDPASMAENMLKKSEQLKAEAERLMAAGDDWEPQEREPARGTKSPAQKSAA